MKRRKTKSGKGGAGYNVARVVIEEIEAACERAACERGRQRKRTMSQDTTSGEGRRLLAAASGSTIETSEDEDAAYEQLMQELADTCQAELRPCAGCQQGSICDGWTAVASSDLLGLIVTRRAHDFHCCVTGIPQEWDCGKTVAESIGKWVQTHGSNYGISVEWPNDKR